MQSYIFKVKIADNLAIFCVRDLKWHESLSIEAKSYRTEESDLYFSGEYQRREILKKAIVWVYDLINEKLDTTDLDVGIYNVWFTMEMGENVFISDRMNLQIFT
jgi:hypothetical protein